MSRLQPVILSGGSGTRLWPLSRGLYPKQYMRMEGDTLFAKTVARAAMLPDAAPPLVICNQAHRFLAAAIVQEQASRPGQELAGCSSLLLEPVGRNTAPAIAVSAFAAMDGGDDPFLLVLSSDHAIEPHSAFAKAVNSALTAAGQDFLTVFGVVPQGPETGFGYIQSGEEVLPGIFGVSAFVEKPDKSRAEAMLRQGGFLWNSGMFLFKASVFLQELERYAPNVHAACRTIWQNRSRDLDFTRFREEDFENCPSISVDYAVMEHTKKACVVPFDASWNDMGSWQAFYECAPKDAAGNACIGDVVHLESKGCYIHSSHRLVAALGLEDVDIVESADAVLVLPRERSQDVKLLTDELKRRKRSETDTHLKVYRPWGSYECIALGERFQVKRLIVNPGAVLSLQKHHHRAEHWVVVRGTAKVTVNDAEIILREDESSYIPLGAMHRLENPGRIPLEVIEIQTGSYLGEDDIVRFEDTYGRVPVS